MLLRGGCRLEVCGWVTMEQGREALVGFTVAHSGWPCCCRLWLLDTRLRGGCWLVVHD